MPAKGRKRTDPRGEATRAALIEAAESLFAEAGVEGISTRQIGAAIGSSNTNVVAYHFGSKDALVREIYRYRLPAIDQRRRELLGELDEQGIGQDLIALVRIFYRPLFEQIDSDGNHSYARFLSGLERSGLISTRLQVSAEFPETDRLVQRIQSALPDRVIPFFSDRLQMTTLLVASALRQIDREQTGAHSARASVLFENAICMVAAALAAPTPATDKA